MKLEDWNNPHGEHYWLMSSFILSHIGPQCHTEHWELSKCIFHRSRGPGMVRISHCTRWLRASNTVYRHLFLSHKALDVGTAIDREAWTGTHGLATCVTSYHILQGLSLLYTALGNKISKDWIFFFQNVLEWW